MKRIDVLTLAAVAALTVPVWAQGPDARVFATSTDNEFVVVNFLSGTTAVAGQASGSNFQGLAVRADGSEIRVLVSSSSQGGKLLIFDPDGGSSAVVAEGFAGGLGGLTVDGAGNAFAVSEGGGATAVWAILRNPACDGAAMTAVGGCMPGGYSAPEKIVDAVPGADRLADVKVVPYSGAGLEAGDLLVAAARPGRLYRIANPLGDHDHGEHAAPTIYSDALAGFEPTGIAFAPDGDILASVWEGDVRILSPANAALSSSFVGGTPGNATGITVGLLGDDFNVFVSTHNGGAVARYDLDGSLLQNVSDGFHAPNGIGTLVATLGAATPAGTDQTVRSTADEITFDVVTEAGVTTIQAFVFEDPRDGVGENFSEPLADPLVLADVPGLPADVPADLVIPAHFRPRSDASGRKIIVLLRGDTTALFAGTINHHIFAHFGAEADCDAAESYYQPRLLWARDTGGAMEDITSGCGSDVGRAWRFSWFALVHDTRSLEDATGDKLAALDDAAACLGRRGRSERKAISTAQRDARRGLFCDVQSGLEGLAADLDATLGSCEAEVEARALSTAYTASLACAAGQ